MSETTHEVRHACHPDDFKSYDTQKIRDQFLIEGLLQADQIRMSYTHFDRFIAGGVMPKTMALELESIDPLKSEYFLERRELGIINVGAEGSIDVDGTIFNLGFKEALYVGKGNKKIRFMSKEASTPAKFYFNSAPAHHAYPNKLITDAEAELVELGSIEASNARTIRKLIVNSIVDTCQLQMGMTEMKKGSVWNTMPAHHHDRRMEIYFYFELPEDQAVCHFMGQPHETRHIWLHNEDAVISPSWSIHSGSGTSNYTFIWGMAGENLDYGDMDKCTVAELR